MKIKGASISAIVLALIVLFSMTPHARRVVAATLINLTNQVTGILAHANGGTDVSSPGAANNVLTSNGTGWSSQPPSGGGSGSTSTGTPNPKFRHWSYCASASQLTLTSAYACVGDTIFGSNSGTPGSAAPFCGSCTPFPTTAPYAYSTWENSSSAGYNTSTTWGTGQNLYFATRVGMSSVTVTNMRVRFGLGTWPSTGAIANADTQPTNQLATFRFSEAIDTHWICEAANGTAEATADSGITPAANTPYLLEIKFNDSVPNIVYSVNGSAVCTMTSDLPLSSKSLQVGHGMAGAGVSGWGTFVVWHYVESDN